MNKWIMLSLSLTLSSQVFAADVKTECQEIGINNSQECVLSVSDADVANVYGITNMPYALCSMTACTATDNKNLADCECELINEKEGWKSLSGSPTTFVSAKPTYNENGTLQTVQSNYSMANISDFSAAPTQKCNYDKPQPWANCYGVRCTVENKTVAGKEQQIAHCVCPVLEDKTFLIGAPEQSACAKKDVIWSATTGDTMSSFGANPMVLLYQKIDPQSPPIKDSKKSTE